MYTKRKEVVEDSVEVYDDVRKIWVKLGGLSTNLDDNEFAQMMELPLEE